MLRSRFEGSSAPTEPYLGTSAGRIDVLFEPAGTQGYDDLVRGAVRFEALGVELLAALRFLVFGFFLDVAAWSALGTDLAIRRALAVFPIVRLVSGAGSSPAVPNSSPNSSDKPSAARIFSFLGPLFDKGIPLPALAMRSFSSTLRNLKSSSGCSSSRAPMP